MTLLPFLLLAWLSLTLSKNALLGEDWVAELFDICVHEPICLDKYFPLAAASPPELDTFRYILSMADASPGFEYLNTSRLAVNRQNNLTLALAMVTSFPGYGLCTPSSYKPFIQSGSYSFYCACAVDNTGDCLYPRGLPTYYLVEGASSFFASPNDCPSSTVTWILVLLLVASIALWLLHAGGIAYMVWLYSIQHSQKNKKVTFNKF